MLVMGRIWRWQDEEAEKFFAEARQLLLTHGVMAIPTETFYALAASPFEEEALHRLFALKSRAVHKPVLVLISHLGMLESLVTEVPEVAQQLMARFWPGPLTLILPARPQLPELLTGGTSRVGLRQPRHPLTCRLIAALGFPVTGTSANRAGQPPLTRAEEVAQEFGDEVPWVVDTGPCPGGPPSTIVDVTVRPPRLVRPGVIKIDQLTEVIAQITA